MKIEELLNIQLKKEVLIELEKLYDINTINLTKEEFITTSETKYDKYSREINFLNKYDKNFLNNEKKCNYDSNQRCCARTWDNHYGTRCRYKKIENTDYCNHHNRTLNKTNKLVFNRYDEQRPILNENGNRIPWFENTNIKILDNIVQKQHKSLLKLINK